MVSHPLILLFYRISALFNTMMGIFHKKTTENNYFINKTYIPSPDDPLIEDQDGKAGLRYGSKTFAHSGCAAAAVYNALRILGDPVPLADIIRHFEGHGAAFFAALGTAPQAAVKYFSGLGYYPIRTSNRRKFRELAENSDVMIFTIMNDRRSIRRMLHTMCVEHNNACFTVHNSHGRAETYPNYDEMMANLGDGGGKADGVYLVGIRKC